jgi:hypothetical protein
VNANPLFLINSPSLATRKIQLLIIIAITALNRSTHHHYRRNIDCKATTMPPAQKYKGRDEHQLFVKHVPADTAKYALPDLFAPYNPRSVRNLYPDSYDTTVVLSFSTHDEASRAYEDTNGLRIDNTVLHVEMWSEQRTTRPLAVTEGYEAGQSRKPISKPATTRYQTPVEIIERTDTPVSDTGSNHLKPGDGATWAQVVRPKQPLPATVTDRPAISPVLPTVTDKAFLGRTAASPQIQVNAEPEGLAWSGLPAKSPTCVTEDPGYGEGDTTDGVSYGVVYTFKDRQDKEPIVTRAHLTAVPPGSYSAWDSTNTSDRISHAHCRNCGFCRARLRRPDLNQ